MGLKNTAYALVVSSLFPIISTGCETLLKLDDVAERAFRDRNFEKSGLPLMDDEGSFEDMVENNYNY
jgi:hypothetical protein